MENPIENGAPKVETIKTSEGNEVSFCPERGGIITSIKLKGREILYLDPATLQDRKVNVEGGIPILFPNAGPIESALYPNLKQHGFARDSSLWKVEKGVRGFKETLGSSEETKAIFPYNFRFTMKGMLEGDNSFTIYSEAVNQGEKEDLPLAMGLHPYFKVPNDKKLEIKFNFEGGKSIEEQVGVWANGQYVSVDNPVIKDPNARVEVVIPSLGTLTLEVSPEYKKIWVWSMPGKDFVCVEPVMRDIGGLVEDPEKVAPGGALHASVNFTLK